MESIPQFAHVLLFACPACSRALATACNSLKRNLESGDGHYFQPHCHCGWTGTLMGMEAVKHWVQPWFEQAPVGPGIDGTCDDEGATVRQ